MLTTGQAAKLCSVTPDTVLKWVKSGRIQARRTPGGHYRIPRSELARIESSTITRGFRYCWEYDSEDGDRLERCEECIVYRSRAMRCYELVKLHPDAGHQMSFCTTTCEKCDYYRMVQGQAANVLVVCGEPDLNERLRKEALSSTFNLAVANCEYSLSALVEDFRPDFAVLDCGLGAERARDMANHLLADPRVHLVRVILAAREGEYPEECDRQIFARIQRPFGLLQINDCIAGIRNSVVR